MSGSLATVRVATRDWLTDVVPGLTEVRLAKPKNWDSRDWAYDKAVYGGLSCAAGYVHVEGGDSNVKSVAQGRGGARIDQHSVALIILFKSRSRDVEESVQHLDEIIDGVVTRVASDPSWGGTVWSATQGLLTWDLDLPEEGGGFTVWARVTFDVETPTRTTGLL